MTIVFKWGLRTTGILIVAFLASGLTFGLASSENKNFLHKVNTLFGEQNIVHNFSSMNEIFPSARVTSVSKGKDLPETFAPIAQTYNYGGETRNVADGLAILQTTSLIVLHNGNIRYEKYYKGTAKDDHRIAWSLSKSMISALIGIAVDEGQISSLDDFVIRYLPELKDSAYKKATIQNVMNMASGVSSYEGPFDPNSDMNRLSRQLALGASMDDYVASLAEVDRPPGTKRHYTSIDTQVLSMILRKATGRSLMQYHADKIWSKMGNREDFYYVTDSHGVALAWGGVNMRTRDLARFGQMFLNKGKWNGEQIVPANWVEESTMASAPAAANPLDKFQYGYQWWIPPAADQEYFALGAYGQYIYINPKAQTIVVKTAANHRGRFESKDENIAIFRAISEHYSDWQYPG